ncbi:hypothetical protein J3R30DRAFT_3279097 [Lentinula aciculospora]|uniref:F-box domain-containing protein n=1 Tax=Lentinula aciculospora TaxID=153920 RepID=A0A9W9DXZ0_9AGAR|nr:hypothetical protein J3R30DRAFT_3279097 [Lentinula aciculospora]
MIKFLDLPLDLLPIIFYHLTLPQDLQEVCLVNKIFNRFATPKLYEQIRIYSWHKQSKEKANISRHLSRYSHVAEHVRRLELRDFPKALGGNDGNDTLEMVVNGLRNCINLRSCTWTRDGSLNSGILEALQCPRNLQTLEINGHAEGNYDPQLLIQFSGLQKISLIMPSSSVISVLRPWLQRTGTSLKSLTIICKTSSILTNAKLKLLAPYLSQLKHFHLTGCSKVTQEGIESVLSAIENGIVSLGLEGLSPKFDVSQFRVYCNRTNAFRCLRSITLTVNQQIPLNAWMDEVAALLPASVPLETFQVYSSGTFIEESPVTERFWSDLVNTHQDRLTRFSIHRMLISLNTIKDICQRCTKLEQLFVVIEQGSLGKLSTCLSLAPNLRVVHLNYPLEASQRENTVSVLPESDAQQIVERCNPNIAQFGCNTRVWQVDREVLLDQEGAPIGIKRRVMRYRGLDIPEPFLVVRT